MISFYNQMKNLLNETRLPVEYFPHENVIILIKDYFDCWTSPFLKFLLQLWAKTEQPCLPESRSNHNWNIW